MRGESNSVINVINLHTSNLLFPLLHIGKLFFSPLLILKMFGFFQAARLRWERENEVSDLRRGDPVEIAIIKITLLGFLLHFLFDLLHSPRGSWVGTEDSLA